MTLTHSVCRLRVISFLACLALSVSQSRADLLLFYDFNDASNEDVVVDVTGNGNEGDVIEAEYTGDGGGVSGQAGDRAMDFGFLGDGRYVEVTTAPDGAFDSVVDNDQFTISLWINGAEQPANQWNFYAGPNRQLGSHIPWGDGVIYFDVAGAPGDCCGPTRRINKSEPDDTKWGDQWNHYVFTKNETETAIYQNGELFHNSGGDDKDPLSEITEFYVGSGPPGDQRSYSGLIDDFCVWDNALTEAEIMDVFTNGCVGSGGGDPGDFNGDGNIDVLDIDLLTNEIKTGGTGAIFDLNNDGNVDTNDHRAWVKDIRKTWFGDANLNGEFNSGDLVNVFQAGKFEDGVPMNASWAEGDWNHDGDFTSGDFVVAFQDGGYEMGPLPAAAAVPEPHSLLLIAAGGTFLMIIRRNRWRH